MTKSFDELYAPKAMSLDELFAAIRPPPLFPANYQPSDDNSAFTPGSSASAANMRQPIPPDRSWAGVQSAPLTSFGAPQTPVTPIAANMPSAPLNSVVPRSYADDPTNRRLQTSVLDQNGVNVHRRQTERVRT